VEDCPVAAQGNQKISVTAHPRDDLGVPAIAEKNLNATIAELMSKPLGFFDSPVTAGMIENCDAL